MKQGQLLKVDRRLRGNITAVIKYIKGCRKKEGSNLFSTSRVDRIKITGLSHNKKHSHFIKKKTTKTPNLLAVKHWTMLQEEAAVSLPHLQNSYPTTGVAKAHLALLGHWKPLPCLTSGNSFMLTFPNCSSWLQDEKPQIFPWSPVSKPPLFPKESYVW